MIFAIKEALKKAKQLNVKYVDYFRDTFSVNEWNYYCSLNLGLECQEFRTSYSSCGNGVKALTIEGELMPDFRDPESKDNWVEIIFFTGSNGTHEEADDLEPDCSDFFKHLNEYKLLTNKNR